MGIAFRSVSEGVWEEDIDNPQFKIYLREGWGVVLQDTIDGLCMTGGSIDLLDNDGEKVTSLVFQHYAAAPLPSVPLPEWFVIFPLEDLRSGYWTAGLKLDDNRKGEGCWIVIDADGDSGCECPRYHDCIQFEPPYGCANCDERWSQFYSKAEWAAQMHRMFEPEMEATQLGDLLKAELARLEE
jgi:hypothetical protein